MKEHDEQNRETKKNVRSISRWIQSGVRRMVDQHRRRTALQRSIFSVTIAGILTGIALGAGWSVSSRMLAGWNDRFEQPDRIAGFHAPSPVETTESTIGRVTPDGVRQDGTRNLSKEKTPSKEGPALITPQRPEPPVTSDRIRESGEVAPSTNTSENSLREEPRDIVWGVPASAEEMIWPVSGSITRPFGWYRHPVFGDWRYTASTALETTAEDRSVRAVLGGQVKDVVNEGGRWRVTVYHPGGFTSEYEGLVSIDVASYAKVDVGKKIGTAPHPGAGRPVSFALYQDGEAMDPQTVIDGPGLPVMAP